MSSESQNSIMKASLNSLRAIKAIGGSDPLGLKGKVDQTKGSKLEALKDFMSSSSMTAAELNTLEEKFGISKEILKSQQFERLPGLQLTDALKAGDNSAFSKIEKEKLKNNVADVAAQEFQARKAPGGLVGSEEAELSDQAEQNRRDISGDIDSALKKSTTAELIAKNAEDANKANEITTSGFSRDDINEILDGFREFFGEGGGFGGGGGDFGERGRGSVGTGTGQDLSSPDADPFMQAMNGGTKSDGAPAMNPKLREFLTATGFEKVESSQAEQLQDALGLKDGQKAVVVFDGRGLLGNIDKDKVDALRAEGIQVVRVDKGSQQDKELQALGINGQAGKGLFVGMANKDSANEMNHNAYKSDVIALDDLEVYAKGMSNANLSRLAGDEGKVTTASGEVKTLADWDPGIRSAEQVEKRDGQELVNLADKSGAAGLDSRNWQTLATIMGDQYTQLNNGDKAAAATALAAKAKEYSDVGVKDAYMIGKLFSENISAQEYGEGTSDRAVQAKEDYERYSKKGYSYSAAESEIDTKYGAGTAKFISGITGIDQSDAGKMAGNTWYAGQDTFAKMIENGLHYHLDNNAKAMDMTLSCPKGKDHNGALYMGQGAVTGLFSSDSKALVNLSTKDDHHMFTSILRLGFIPSKEKIAELAQSKGMTEKEFTKDYLSKGITAQEKELYEYLNGNASDKDKIAKFNQYAADNDLVKNVGFGNYLTKGHGWSGGTNLHDNGSLTSSDKAVFAMMGLASSEAVGNVRVHYQSCSTDEGCREGTFADVTNEVMANFAPSNVKVSIAAGDQIVWNGQGDVFQSIRMENGYALNRGKLTGMNIREKYGQNDSWKDNEHTMARLAKLTKDENGVLTAVPGANASNDPMLAAIENSRNEAVSEADPAVTDVWLASTDSTAAEERNNNAETKTPEENNDEETQKDKAFVV